MAEPAENDVETESPKATGQPGTLRDRYVVSTTKPLKDLSTSNADAFVAEDKRDPNRALYALVCRSELPHRVNAMRMLKGIQTPALIQMVEWGAMNWPLANRQCMTILYERPLPRRLMTNIRSECKRIDEYNIGPRFVEPMVNAIREMNQRGVTHRSIRPTNMFYMDETGERIALGDGVTVPPAYDQPVVFEPVESAMCNTVARGAGTYSDDLYSLGVSTAMVFLGRNPVAHLDDDGVLRSKIQYGSYGTIVGDERLPLPLLELLRGLLCDDPDQRWDIESLDFWTSGRRLSPLQQRLEKRAARMFPFNGKEYGNCRELAAAMARNWELAIPAVMEGKVELWLRRALEDQERAQAVSDVVRQALNGGGDRKVAADLMLCKVLIMLDPSAPLRYKGFIAMPDGIGTALAAVMGQKTDNRLITEVILREVPRMWFEARKVYLPDNSLMEGSFRELKNYLSQTGTGFGMERCLYELNDSMPCLSPLVGEEYVVELKELLPALNINAAKKVNSKDWPIDRHVAAFMGARARSDIDRNLTQLADSDSKQALMAMVNLFAVFQYRLGPDQLPNLAAWIVNLLKPAIDGYNSREKRKELEKELPKLVKRGSLVDVHNLLDNPTEREKDKNEFAWAQAQYQAAEDEIRRIQTDGEERAKEATMVGKQTAAVTGILIGMIVATLTIISKIW